MTTYYPEFTKNLCQIKIDEIETTEDCLKIIEFLFGNNKSSIIKANINLNNKIKYYYIDNSS